MLVKGATVGGRQWTLRWRNNARDGVSNHQPYDCLLNRLFRRRSKKTSKLRVTGLCAGKSLVTGEFHTQMASDAENVSIWWRHHGFLEEGNFKNDILASKSVTRWAQDNTNDILKLIFLNGIFIMISLAYAPKGSFY